MRNEFDYYLEGNEPGYFPSCAYSDGPNSCDPYVQISPNCERNSSLWALFGLYAGCYMISWFILTRLTKTFE